MSRWVWSKPTRISRCVAMLHHPSCMRRPLKLQPVQSSICSPLFRVASESGARTRTLAALTRRARSALEPQTRRRADAGRHINDHSRRAVGSQLLPPPRRAEHWTPPARPRPSRLARRQVTLTRAAFPVTLGSGPGTGRAGPATARVGRFVMKHSGTAPPPFPILEPSSLHFRSPPRTLTPVPAPTHARGRPDATAAASTPVAAAAGGR